ncbi:MAG: hypothetical protein EOP04_06485 [Proteobacteria bacterium]|nr:MAG: hypothetical protein EOP04_06485 [Pseudomonadota bacterium]
MVFQNRLFDGITTSMVDFRLTQTLAFGYNLGPTKRFAYEGTQHVSHQLATFLVARIFVGENIIEATKKRAI